MTSISFTEESGTAGERPERRGASRISWCVPLLFVLLILPFYLYGSFPPSITVAAHLACFGILLFLPRAYGTPWYTVPAGWVRCHAGRLLAVLILSFSVGFCLLNVIKYHHYGYCGQDVKLFAQSMYTTLRCGELFFNDVEGPHFGYHFSPFLFFLLPLYAVVTHPLTLVCVKVIALACAVVPLYYLGRDALGRGYGFTIAAAYLVSLPVLGQFLFEFYELQFVPLLVFLAFLFHERDRPVACTIILLLLLTVREEMGLFVFMFGLHSVVKEGRNGWAVAWCVAGAAWLAITVGFVIPAWNPDGRYMAEFLWDSGCAGPLSCFGNIFSRSYFHYCYLLVGPLLFTLPFFLPVVMVAIPFVVWVAVAGRDDIGYHYHAFILAVLFVGVIRTLARRRERGQAHGGCHLPDPVRLVAFFLVSAAFTAAHYLPGMRAELLTPYGHRADPLPRGYLNSVRKACGIIPRDAFAVVPRYVAPHCANRCRLAIEYRGDARAHAGWVMMDESTGDEFTITRINRAFTRDRDEHATFHEVYHQGGIRLFKREP